MLDKRCEILFESEKAGWTRTHTLHAVEVSNELFGKPQLVDVRAYADLERSCYCRPDPTDVLAAVELSLDGALRQRLGIARINAQEADGVALSRLRGDLERNQVFDLSGRKAKLSADPC